MNLDLVRRGHLVVEPKHLTHQGATSVALVVDAVHPSLRLFHHIEAIATMAYLLLPSLSIVDLAEGGVTAVPLIDLALLIRRDLDEVILVGRALLLLAVRHASLDLILLLVLTFLHLTAVAIDEVGIERLKILQHQLLCHRLVCLSSLLRLALGSLPLRWKPDGLVHSPCDRPLLLIRRLEDATLRRFRAI